jgi:hypothetical protein
MNLYGRHLVETARLSLPKSGVQRFLRLKNWIPAFGGMPGKRILVLLPDLENYLSAFICVNLRPKKL